MRLESSNMLRLLLSLLLLLCTPTTSHTPSPDHVVLTATPASQRKTPTEYFEATVPVPRDPRLPSCNVLVFQHSFSNTLGSPLFKATYSPPSDCSQPWSAIYIELNASCSGEQSYRIAGVWIDGVEILRTSTAQATEFGVFWNVRKDVTRYASMLQQSNSTVTMMLRNAVDDVLNDVLNGIFDVTLSLNFYKASTIRVSGEEDGEEGGSLKLGGKSGFWGEESVDLGEGVSEKREKGILGKESSKGNSELGFLSKEPLEKGKEEGGERVRTLGSLPEESVEQKGELDFLLEENAGIAVEREEKLLSGFLPKESSFLIGGRLGFPVELPVVPNDQDGAFQLQQEEHAEMRTRDTFRSLYNEPADLIIPISVDGGKGSWFRIQNESDIRSKEIQIPANAYRAVLEIYVSFHGNDEFWYSNPPNSYIQKNNLTTERGNGAFRQVLATIDGLYVGEVVPFPVIYAGGINPLFWKPAVAIGAFHLPSYDLDLTPFLGNLLDGNSHKFGLSVTNALSFWLVDANLHLWLDSWSQTVEAKLVKYHAPNASFEREFGYLALNGRFKTVTKRKIEFSGWVRSSAGNLTTDVVHEFKFKSKINYAEDGNFKEVKQKIKTETEVKVVTYRGSLLAQAIYQNKYPLKIKTSTVPKGYNSYLSKTGLTHRRKEQSSVVLAGQSYFRDLDNSQHSEGWMLVEDHSVLSGKGTTEQDYKYQDNKGCYSQKVTTKDGEVKENHKMEYCSVPPKYIFL